MAYYFIFPEKDTTIYSHPDRLNLNSGHDEIIEVVKEKGTINQQYYPSRALIQFHSADIIDVFQNKIPTQIVSDETWKADLEMFAAQHKNLATTTNIYTYPLSQSWEEGTGRYNNRPSSSNGTTWRYKDNDTIKTLWTTGSIVTGATYASASIILMPTPPYPDTSGERMSGSAHELTINGVDFIPVYSASLFDSNDSEVFVQISASLDLFGANLVEAINVSSSVTLVSASYDAPTNKLSLSGSTTGTVGNVTISTGSIANGQFVFSCLSSSLTGGSDSTQGGFGPNSTGSINAVGITEGGGTWWTGSGFTANQQFLESSNKDVKLNVTDIVNKHQNYLINSSTYPTGIPNRGFILKYADTVETSTSSSEGELQYFSSDTHTIYPPKLTFKWDDSSWNPVGTKLTSGDIFLSLHNNKATFQRKSKQRFRLTTRKRYPDRTFTTSSNYLDIQYLPETSYYSLRDGETDEVIIPFDTSYTKLSADSDGMYFDLWMEGLQPERYYKLMFRSDDSEGIKIFDEDYIFKVIR